MRAVTGLPKLNRGVRFRRLDDGKGILLVPEGVINLNTTAAAVVELLDGKRSADDIASELAARFSASIGSIRADVNELLERLSQRTWVVFEPQ